MLQVHWQKERTQKNIHEPDTLSLTLTSHTPFARALNHVTQSSSADAHLLSSHGHIDRVLGLLPLINVAYI